MRRLTGGPGPGSGAGRPRRCPRGRCARASRRASGRAATGRRCGSWRRSGAKPKACGERLEVEDVELPVRAGAAVDRRHPADVAGELDDPVAVALEEVDQADQLLERRCLVVSDQLGLVHQAAGQLARRPAPVAGDSSGRAHEAVEWGQCGAQPARRPGARRRSPGSGGRAPATAARPAGGSRGEPAASPGAGARARAARPRSGASGARSPRACGCPGPRRRPAARPGRRGW